MKNPLTLAGIEPATLRFVAQHLNHCATAVPVIYTRDIKSTEILANFKARLGACNVLLGGKSNILCKVRVSSKMLHIRHSQLCA